MAGVHGREWIAPVAAAWALVELQTNGKYVESLRKFTFHFLCLVNPDGYDYSRTTSETQDRRQWRKNRRLLPCKGDRCAHGVDLNRNWGVEGKTFGFGATRPTSDVFQGKRPFSEPEIRAIRDWLLVNNRGKRISFVLDIHCCAQTVLPPSYYHDETLDTKAQHLAIAGRLAEAMGEVNGEKYGHREREKEFSATNSGISVDWLYGEGGVGLALLIETRGNDKTKKLENIFDVDSKLIGPIGNEVLAAIIAATREIKLPGWTFPSDEVIAKEELPPLYTAPILSAAALRTSRPTYAEAELVAVVASIRQRQEEQHDMTVETQTIGDFSSESSEDGGSISQEEVLEDDGPPPPPLLDIENEQDGVPPPPPPLLMGDFAAPATMTEEEDDNKGAATVVPLAGEAPPPLPDEMVDLEIQEILDEVKKTEEELELHHFGAAKDGDDFEEFDSLMTDIPTHDRGKVIAAMRYEHQGLTIVDEEQEEDDDRIVALNTAKDKFKRDKQNEVDDAELTRRLRRRIEQLRAYRSASQPSLWLAFKARVRGGKWRAPLAFGIFVLAFWHFVNRRRAAANQFFNARSRDD